MHGHTHSRLLFRVYFFAAVLPFGFAARHRRKRETRPANRSTTQTDAKDVEQQQHRRGEQRHNNKNNGGKKNGYTQVL